MTSRSSEKEPTTGPKLWVVLARTYAALSAFVERSLADEGLGLSDFMVLEVLLHKGPLPISAIGQKVLLANPSMTSAVDRLEERELVVRQTSTVDRRSKLVALTARGRKLIAALYKAHAAELDGVASVLNKAERDQLRTLLKRFGYAAAAAAETDEAG